MESTPDLAPHRTVAPLRLTRLASRTFDRAPYTPTAAQLDHHAALAALHGLSFRKELFTAAGRDGYAAMAADLVGQDGLDLAGTDLDLILVGHAVPDIDVDRFAAVELSHVLSSGGMPLGFTDQGPTTPFTALRIAGEYANSGLAKAALVVLLDQATLPYVPGPPPEHTPLADTAVGMLFEASKSSGGGLSVHQFTDVTPAELPGLVRELLGALTDTPAAATVVLGPGIGTAGIGTAGIGTAGIGTADIELPGGHRVLRTPPGRPATGLWWRLARADRCHGRLVLADYDHIGRCLSMASLDDTGATRLRGELE